MSLPTGTVIAIVDGKNFELYRNDGTEGEPELASMTSPQLDSSNHSGGSHRSSSGNPGGHQDEEDAHAIAAVNWLNREVLDHRIEHLVIIAPPRTLGEVRPHYHKQTEQALVQDVSKDMIGKQPSEILAALRDEE